MKIKNPIWHKLIDEYGLKVRIYDEGYNIWSACFVYKSDDRFNNTFEVLRICEEEHFDSFYVATELHDYSTDDMVILSAGYLRPVESYEYAKSQIDNLILQTKKIKAQFELNKIKVDF